MEKDQEVFVVQAGQDSYHEDGQIIAICTTLEKAEEFKSNHENRKCDHSACDFKYSACIFKMKIR